MGTLVQSLEAAVHARRAALKYSLVDLGEHVDGAPLLPVAINRRGAIAAVATSPKAAGASRGFCLTGGLRLPAGIAFGQDPVSGISDTGYLVGATGIAPKALSAWACSRGDFGTQYWPEWSSVARGVNSHGEIVGDVARDAGWLTIGCAFVIGPSGHSRLLSAPEGGATAAIGINDQGHVLFNAEPLGHGTGLSSAWCVQAGACRAVQGLGGRWTRATALTASGAVAGIGRTAAGELRSFWWEDGVVSDLGAFEALGAADPSLVVGRRIEAGQAPRACVWQPSCGTAFLDEMTDMPLDWSLREACAVNAQGVIIGRGESQGRPRGFALYPIASR